MSTIDIRQVIQTAQGYGASDIHVIYGKPIRIRIDGSLRNYDEHILDDDDCTKIARNMAGDKLDAIKDIGEIDFASTIGGSIRCRFNVFKQQGHYSSAIRILNDKIPQLDKLGLPPIVSDFAKYPRGIVLVTGETGSGKSTTLAALIDQINQTRHEHIITLEDPIEYVYEQKLCSINQREIGQDTKSYQNGLRAILREDPDIILIGELRELETIEIALTAAETGHLVFATVHTNSAADTIDRVVNVFPGEKQQQIRLQLSMTLKAVLCQQLLPHASGKGRALACEVMTTNSAIKNLIREGKTPQIMNAIATSAAEGNISMDNFILNLYKNNQITAQTAIDAAHDADYVKQAIAASTYRSDRMR